MIWYTSQKFGINMGRHFVSWVTRLYLKVKSPPGTVFVQSEYKKMQQETCPPFVVELNIVASYVHG